MPKIIISGCNGHMGQSVAAICAAAQGVEVAAGFNRTPVKKNDFPVYADPMEYMGPADVIVDFSNPANLDGLLAYSIKRRIPIVLCTTGYSQEQLEAISAAGGKVPVFRSGNMSLGINLLLKLTRQAASVLEGFDIEILEAHHNRKVDAPSGTALMLAEAAAQGVEYQPEYVYERHSVRQRRDPKEIGISSIRGGTIVGEHQVIFSGPNEVVRLCHSAQSRDVFAQGAVTAAKYMARVTKPGSYSMDDVLADIFG